ncbi:odorant receptor 131-2-like [Latimeria chalumnae]|uniref:odorant receptor 131-2-like n=1 Tax=Latimeria chalumnae TaxID=7897 RepID=UPI0006D8DAF1|nr:PREDICTED: olfactory receptor 4D10-like [Latimeria chalumnae]|eukprot:XP_014351724.1 PREDICTED: olfactory receptor 4D10-like [Latimeria chalumnae]
MENISSFSMNLTQPTNTLSVLNLFNTIFVVPFIAAFLYINILMLYTFCLGRIFWESSRYILFAHMLINDTIQLVIAVLLLWLYEMQLKIPFPICFTLIIVTGTAYLNTPLSLAAMSLERYIAICFPLRHVEICRVDRLWVVIVTIWMTGLIPYITDLVVLCVLLDRTFFSQNISCKRQNLLLTRFQNILRSVVHAIEFSSVCMTMLYTYVKILLQARKVSTNNSSASKAHKTVVLHAVQLLLCLTSFTHPITERLLLGLDNWVYTNLAFLNFVVFILFPRCLSPLIYGLRDEMFRTHLRRHLPRCLKKIRQVLPRN